jgi:tetratricopeptide (TPR) repeat protein
VPRDELHAAIWGDTAVTPDALVQCIVDIRKVLGDNPKQPRFIRTVPRVGYGFMGPVEEAGGAAPATPAPAASEPAIPPPPDPDGEPSTRWRPRSWLIAAAAAAVTGVLAIGFFARVASTERIEWPASAGGKRIVVLPFRNESRDRGTAWLQNGLPNMLITGLGRSRGVSAVTLAELRAMPAGGGREPEPPDADEGMAIARAARADAIIRGSFTTVGDALRIDVRILSATGEPLGTEVVVAPRREDVLTQIDRLSERLTTDLGLPVTGRAATLRLSEVMTKDLDAYRDYVLGVQKASAMEPEAAIALFGSAARRDPEFAMAHARIGATYTVTMGAAHKGQPYLARAFQLSDRLREVDRLWILAWHALAKLDYDGAMELLRTLNARYPGDIEAYSILGGILIGQERWTEAAEVIERGLAIDPDARELHNQASRAAAGAGRGGAALEAARRYVAVAPHEANARDTLGLRLQDLGRWDEAIDAFDQALRINPRFEIALAHKGNAYFAQGRYREAAAAYEDFAKAHADQNASRGIAALAWIAFRRGDRARAWTLAEQAAAASPRDPWPALYLAVDRRDPVAYRRIKAQSAWEKYSNRGTPWPPILVRYMTALDLRIAGRHDEALAQLRDAVAHAPLGWAIDPLEDCLAQAYFDLERWEEARVEFQRLVDQRPWVARYYYRLGQLADRRGDHPTATALYRQFLTRWPQADADLPEVIAARGRIDPGSH